MSNNPADEGVVNQTTEEESPRRMQEKSMSEVQAEAQDDLF